MLTPLASSVTETLTQQHIRTRRTHFQFEDQPVPADILERALSAAHWAPNHKHTWPWRFMVAGPQMQLKLVSYFTDKLRKKLAQRGMRDAAIEVFVEKSMARQQKMPLQIIAYTLQGDNPHQNREDYASTCCAVQNLTLSLWSEGVASGWKTFDSEAAYALTGLTPENHLLVGLIQAGYPLCEGTGRRPPLEEHVIYTD